MLPAHRLPCVSSITWRFWVPCESLWLYHTGLAPPQKRAPLPRQITFQRKRANRRVINEDQLIHLLQEFGEVLHPAVCQRAAS